MMLHISSSSPPGFEHFPHKIVEKPVKKELLDDSPAGIVDVALQALQGAGIEPVEWGPLLYHRMHVPVIVKVICCFFLVGRLVSNFGLQDYFYLVADDKLEAASDILSVLGLPFWPPSGLLVKTEGDFSVKGLYHRITRSILPSSISSICLFPLSFSTLLPSELETKPPHHLRPSSRCPTILVPRPSAVYASLIRMMAKYPQYCATRTVLASDLSELVCYDFLDLQDGFTDPDDDALWKELDGDGRIERAIALIRRWSCEGEWREGEEWIGEALAGVVDGSVDISCLPSST
jgi:hypothetical protein